MSHQPDLLPVKSTCFAIVFPLNDPDMLIPVRGVVEDVVLHPVLPKYAVRITSVYESVYFVRKHFDGARVRTHRGKTHKLDPPRDALRSLEHFNTWLADGSVRFLCDYMFVHPTKAGMMEYFHALQDYLVVRAVRKLRDVTTKREYAAAGRMGAGGPADFEGRMWAAFADKFRDRAEFAAWMKEVNGPRIYRRQRAKGVSQRRMGRRSGGPGST